VLFSQERIGEGGRPFRIYKLRTMRPDTEQTLWATADDPRVTPLGRLLRRTHLDELPQLLNVLRGEMRIVGPRPEQSGFVEQLEQAIPYYQRRHVLKPGLTGWAQVRCGYAGSDVGSAWKVCHDLWYLKQRSLRLDAIIVLETLRTLVADPQYTAEPSSVSFILAPSTDVIEAQPIPVPVPVHQ
jgi:lipopolysaccharide/colanic/teichoic acid biosynthesis glycosyltransferase